MGAKDMVHQWVIWLKSQWEPPNPTHGTWYYKNLRGWENTQSSIMWQRTQVGLDTDNFPLFSGNFCLHHLPSSTTVSWEKRNKYVTWHKRKNNWKPDSKELKSGTHDPQLTVVISTMWETVALVGPFSRTQFLLPNIIYPKTRFNNFLLVKYPDLYLYCIISSWIANHNNNFSNSGNFIKHKMASPLKFQPKSHFFK